jgi:hypothetical protein
MIAGGLSDVLLGGWWTTFFPAVALCLSVIAAAMATSTLAALTAARSRGTAATGRHIESIFRRLLRRESGQLA